MLLKCLYFQNGRHCWGHNSLKHWTFLHSLHFYLGSKSEQKYYINHQIRYHSLCRCVWNDKVWRMRNTHEHYIAKWIIKDIVSYIRGYLVRAINERIKPWAIHLEHKLPICRQGTDRINQRDYPAIGYAWFRVATKVLLLFYACRLTQSTLRLVAAHKYISAL